MKRLLFLAVCTLCIGCSDDNSGTIIDISEEFLFPDFTVVSFDDDAFYAFDFDQNAQSGITTNLTTTLSIPRQVFFVHRDAPVYGFYTQGSAYVVNFESGILNFVGDFGGSGSGEQRITARNDENVLGLIYKFPDNDERFLRLIDIESNARFVVPLGLTSENVKLYINKGKAYVLDSSSSESTLTIIDVATEAIVHQETRSEASSGIIFNRSDAYYVFDFEGNYVKYSATTFEVILESVSGFVPQENVTYKMIDEVVYAQFTYPQPNFYTTAPAAYDLANGTSVFVDIATIFDNYVAREDGVESLATTHFDYNDSQDVWLVTYIAALTNGMEHYGVFAVDGDQQIVGEVALEQLPWTVIAPD